MAALIPLHRCPVICSNKLHNLCVDQKLRVSQETISMTCVLITKLVRFWCVITMASCQAIQEES